MAHLLGLVAVATLCLGLTLLWSIVAGPLGMMAHPGGRHGHRRATPRAGAGLIVGLGVAIIASGLPEGPIICAGLAVSLALGLADDRWVLHAGAKLGGQVCAAAVPVIAGGLGPGSVSLPGLDVVDLSSARAPIWILAIVVVMNIINLIDGHDGLACGLVAIGAATMTCLTLVDGRPQDILLPAILGAGAMSFLALNLPPARIFLGDQGSLGLGYLLAVAAIVSSSKTGAALGIAGATMAMLVPAADALAVAIHRLRQGKRIWTADRTHVHHRLLRRGADDWRVLWTCWAVASCWGVFAVGLRVWPPESSGEIILAAMACLGLCAGSASSLGLSWRRSVPSHPIGIQNL